MEPIQRIWLDNSNILCIQPQARTFEYIYRSAMNICWNESEHYLYHRISGSWSPVDWYRQISSAVENEYGCHLYLTERTIWDNIDESTKETIKKVI